MLNATPTGAALQGLSRSRVGPWDLSITCAPRGAWAPALLGFRVLESVKQGRSAYLLRRSRHAVSTASRSFVSHRASRAPHGRFRGAITGPTCRSSRSLARPSRACHPKPAVDRRSLTHRAEAVSCARLSDPVTRCDFTPGRGNARRGPTTFLGFDFPTALTESGIRFTRALRARHGPAPAFLTLSPAYASRHLSGLISSR